MDWIINNWDICLLAFMILEKAVKLSPSKNDDIVLDIVWNSLKNMVKADDKKRDYRSQIRCCFYNGDGEDNFDTIPSELTIKR